MLDKLSLTIQRVPDYEYLRIHGDLTVDEYRTQIYKDMYMLEKAVVLCRPHKFSEETNMTIPYTKVDLNPKNFGCYEYMESYLRIIFDAPDLMPSEFNVSRIDLAVDTEDFPIQHVLAVIRVNKIRSDTFSFYKGTLYAGSNPKIRIYEKVKEIKARLKKGFLNQAEVIRGLRFRLDQKK
ncbi:MAG: hypothetical protein HY805_01125 [Nitrospirae bacterium]|nr:hypothetical protein [Nitrospirota bacterium]